MKKYLPALLIFSLALISPAIEGSRSFAAMNAEGHSFDIGVLPAGNFSLQPVPNIDITNGISMIPSSLDGAHQMIEESILNTDLALPNLTAKSNPIGEETPIGDQNQKAPANPLRALRDQREVVMPVRNSAKNTVSSFKRTDHLIASQLKKWTMPNAMTQVGLSQNFDNSIASEPSLVSDARVPLPPLRHDPENGYQPTDANRHDKNGYLIEVGDKAVYEGTHYRYRVTVKKLYSDGTALVGYGFGSGLADNYVLTSILNKEVPKINKWEDGDKAVYSDSKYRYSVTVKKLYSDGTALVSYGRGSGLVDSYLPVSILIAEVAQIGYWKVGDKAVYDGSVYRYSVTIKKLYADGTALVSYGFLSDLADQHLPVSILIKRS